MLKYSRKNKRYFQHFSKILKNNYLLNLRRSVSYITNIQEYDNPNNKKLETFCPCKRKFDASQNIQLNRSNRKSHWNTFAYECLTDINRNDRKIMQFIKTASGQAERVDELNLFNQFKWISSKVIPIKKT